MSNISKWFNECVKLNEDLNSKKCPLDINDKFNQLFKEDIFTKTNVWLLNQWGVDVSFHDTFCKKVEENKRLNGFESSMEMGSIYVIKERCEIGKLNGVKIEIESNSSFRDLNKKDVLNFLIDEPNKQIGFLVLVGNRKKIVEGKYDKIKISFDKCEQYVSLKEDSAPSKKIKI